MNQPTTQHTGGEWTVEDGDEYVREASTGATIARVCEDDGHISTRHRRPMPAKANARLIAASPDLLDACKEARQLIHWLTENFTSETPRRVPETVTKLVAAIAKATGDK